jgi:type II secretory pathway pseudopilin PulG
MDVAARDCGCGARFVGEPLGDAPFKVQRFGPAMSAVGLLAIVTSASLIFTKWLALAAALVIWSAWRAMRLAQRDPEGYGGYRTASATLAVTIFASIIAGGYSVAYVSEYMQLRRDRQRAATMANVHHIQNLLEEYKRKNGAYPSSLQALRRISDEALPTDYWDKNFSYQSYTKDIASVRTPIMGINFHNFELRSAGPDEKMGTDDDIIMRDGLFISASEARQQPVLQDITAR